MAGENPSPFEVLLADRMASLWVLVELQEALNAAFYSRGNPSKPKLQESANNRYLAAIRELARVRKLQAGTPAVQR